MEFNLNKCKVMHIGHGNRNSKFYMGEVELGVVKEEKDLGIIVSNDLKVSKQCGAAARKGYQILGMISRAFTSKKKDIMIKLYKSIVRPHVYY